MKKIIILAISMLILSYGIAFGAGDAHMNTGCGLGTMLFKNNADNSILLQVLQATTNTSFGNQTFGITTGTSECRRPAKFVKSERLNQFVADNIDNLARDIARGNGESLDALAELMEIAPEERPEVYLRLQANFSNIFTSERVESADVIDNIVSIISKG